MEEAMAACRRAIELRPELGEAHNSLGAILQETGQLEDGEALIFRPDGRGSASFVARVKIDEWPRLASGS